MFKGRKQHFADFDGVNVTHMVFLTAMECSLAVLRYAYWENVPCRFIQATNAMNNTFPQSQQGYFVARLQDLALE